VGRRHLRTLMRRMAIEVIYRKPNTSKPAPGHKIYPYLLFSGGRSRARSVIWITYDFFRTFDLSFSREGWYKQEERDL
jgi:hypothetical protein